MMGRRWDLLFLFEVLVLNSRLIFLRDLYWTQASIEVVSNAP